MAVRLKSPVQHIISTITESGITVSTEGSGRIVRVSSEGDGEIAGYYQGCRQHGFARMVIVAHPKIEGCDRVSLVPFDTLFE